jgi:NTE family protein
MSASATASGRRQRIGLVLGAGGILGAAWMVGALRAVQDRVDGPLGDVEIMVGTSAGSILAAALRSGIDVDELLRHQRGHSTDLPGLDHVDRTSMPIPPRLGIGSPRLLTLAALAPHRIRSTAAASALIPPGRGRLDAVGNLVDAMARRTGPPGSSGPTWPAKPTWVVAMEYETGRRTVFGRPGSPATALSDAVVASCSIPGWYEPKTIHGRRYVDGGVYSVVSIDLLAGRRLDHVYVLCPLGGLGPADDRSLAATGERILRRCISGWMDIEARKVEAAGTTVTLVTPGADDIEAMGRNLMDPSRRRRVLEISLRTAPARLAAGERATSAAR